VNNLSQVLSYLKDYDGAKQRYLSVIEIFKKHHGEDHFEYAVILSNLSAVLKDLGDYEGAKQGYLTALEIKKKTYGEDHL
jgi:tetratricopeptide (TPR) repeat protein